MTETYHIPVLLRQSIDALDIKGNGVYADLTFGGGGHSKEILKHLGNDGRLLAFDQDKDTLANSRRSFPIARTMGSSFPQARFTTASLPSMTTARTAWN